MRNSVEVVKLFEDVLREAYSPSTDTYVLYPMWVEDVEVRVSFAIKPKESTIYYQHCTMTVPQAMAVLEIMNRFLVKLREMGIKEVYAWETELVFAMPGEENYYGRVSFSALEYC